jgi:hypothetical protein
VSFGEKADEYFGTKQEENFWTSSEPLNFGRQTLTKVLVRSFVSRYDGYR